MSTAPMHRCVLTDAGILIGCAHRETPPQHDTDALAIQDALLADNDAADADALQWLAYGLVVVVAVIGLVCMVSAA
jgi:hypothetical protein